MTRHILSCGLFLAVCIGIRAQDPVFSQFYAAPLHINPAFAGITYAPRITLNYRNQWPSWPNAFVTYAATYEQSLEDFNSGIGLVLLTDNAGDGRYKTNLFSLVYSYQVRLQDEFAIKFGVEAGFIQSTVDWDKLVFEDQIDPINGPTGNGSEELRPANLSKTIFDVSAGLLIYGGNYYGGVSIKHLNSPDESLLNINENLSVGMPLRLTLHGGAEFTLQRGNNRRAPTFISPNVLIIKQAEFGQINLGAYAGMGKVFGGLWYRHGFANPDAAIALIGFRYEALRIGYSFDLTISELSLQRSGGTHEISLSINFDDTREAKRKRKASRHNNCFKMFN